MLNLLRGLILSITLITILNGCSSHTKEQQKTKIDDIKVNWDEWNIIAENGSPVSKEANADIAKVTQNALESYARLFIFISNSDEAFLVVKNFEVLDKRDVSKKYVITGLLHFFSSIKHSVPPAPADIVISKNNNVKNISVNDANYSGHAISVQLIILNPSQHQWELIDIPPRNK